MKRNHLSTIIFVSLLVFSVLNLPLVSSQSKEEILELTESIESAEDLSIVYKRGRLLTTLLSFFSGTCGNGVCGEYEFNCLQDCGKFIIKNGLFGGNEYSGKSSYENVKYKFEVKGECNLREPSGTIRQKVTEGGIIGDMDVAVEYNNKIETFENIKDNEKFVLENGKEFSVNTFGCKNVGFLDVNLNKPKCGDNICWGLVKEPDCPMDCNGMHLRFYQNNEKFIPINSNVIYNGYDYTFRIISTKDYVPTCKLHKEITLEASYFPINNPSSEVVEKFELVSPADSFAINGIKVKASMPCSGPYIDKNIYIVSMKFE